jgi:DNA-binding response OmpR family regulator
MARVLVVDDDPSVRDVVATVLEVDGYEVELVEDGELAVARLDDREAGMPDVVVLDVMMPGMSGFDVLEWMRSHEWAFDVPVIMLTAKVQLEDQLSGWKHGCDGYITKPFDPDDLVEQIEMLLDIGPELRSLRRKDRLEALLARDRGEH